MIRSYLLVALLGVFGVSASTKTRSTPWIDQKPKLLLQELIDKKLGKKRSVFLTSTCKKVYGTSYKNLSKEQKSNMEKLESILLSLHFQDESIMEKPKSTFGKIKTKLVPNWLQNRKIAKKHFKHIVKLVKEADMKAYSNTAKKQGVSGRLAKKLQSFLELYLKKNGSEQHTSFQMNLLKGTLKNTPYGDLSNWKHVVLHRNKGSDVSGVILYKGGEKRVKCFIFFAGTRPAQLLDLVTDIRFRKSDDYDQSAHRGFYNAYQESINSNRRTLVNLIEKGMDTGKPIDVVLAGHSLGFGLALIAAEHVITLLEDIKSFDSTVGVFGVGGPRVFDKKSSDFVEDHIGFHNIVRLSNPKDIVTHIAMSELKFKGTGYKWVVQEDLNFRNIGSDAINYATAAYHKCLYYLAKLEDQHHLYAAQSKVDLKKVKDKSHPLSRKMRLVS